MIRLGLTGSIGMGKSATAAMFRDAGIPVHDSDAAVHRLYAGTAAAPIEAAFPGTVKDGVVDRAALGAAVLNNDAAMKRLEAIVHPLVTEMTINFLAQRCHPCRFCRSCCAKSARARSSRDDAGEVSGDCRPSNPRFGQASACAFCHRYGPGI